MMRDSSERVISITRLSLQPSASGESSSAVQFASGRERALG